MLIPNFPPSAMHILETAYRQYMKELARPAQFSMNDYPGEHKFDWEEMKREALDLQERDLVEIFREIDKMFCTSITLKLTAYGRQYCEETLGFQATTAM